MRDQGVDWFHLILSKLRWADTTLKFLEDRVSVMEERTVSHESRLEDLETWQEKADDILEAS